MNEIDVDLRNGLFVPAPVRANGVLIGMLSAERRDGSVCIFVDPPCHADSWASEDKACEVAKEMVVAFSERLASAFGAKIDRFSFMLPEAEE